MQVGGRRGLSYGRLGSLFASSSLAALLIGSGAPGAYAACNTIYANTTSPGCTNSAAITGIAINNSTITSTIINSGTISPNGIALSNGSTVTGGIEDLGTIGGGISIDGTSKISAPGANDAIAIFGPTLTGGITNSGTLSAGGFGIAAIGGAIFTGGVNNSGTIRTTETGVDVSHVSAFSGGITNSGTISASAGSGIFVSTVSNFSGGMTNSGTISAQHSGIFMQTVSTFSGNVINSGTISAATNGIVITGVSIFAGGLTNSGRIASTGTTGNGILVTQVASFANGISNSGTVSSAGFGIFVGNDTTTTVSNFSGGIANSGTIAAALSGVAVAHVSTFSGGMTNSGKITSSADSGMFAFVVSTFSGGMTNSGTITAHNWGMYAQTMSTFSGDMINSGTISAGTNGIAASGITVFAGGIINSGQLTVSGAAANGILVTQVATFANGISNSGIISSGGYGIFAGNASASSISNFSGGIANSGTITAAKTGIEVSFVSTFSGGVSNSGAISSSGLGILIGGGTTAHSHPVSSFTGGLANSGTITAAKTGIAVSFVSTFSGGMTNSGRISSSAESGMYAFTVSTFSGGMTNSGTISAHNWGMYAQAMSTFSGDMFNSGVITAGSNAIAVESISTFLGGITNTGTISGLHGIEILNTTGVSVFDSGTIIGTSGIAITFATGPNTLTLGPGFDIQGKVVGSGTDIFQLGGTGSGSFNLATIGGGLQYEGFTTFNVVGGVWNTTGTFTPSETWNVNGGTLAGTGTFSWAGGTDIQVNAGGTLEPGTPGAPGTFMTLNGNLVFAPGAAYLVNLNPTTASRANVTGSVTLNGAVQGFLQPGSYNKATTYDILDPSSISGTFTGFTAVNAPGFGGTLTYQPNDVLLNLTAQIGAGGGLSPNQQNPANTINTYFNNGGTLPAGFFPLFGLSGAALGNALAQVSGEPATDAGKGANQLMNDFLNLMLDPTASGGGGANGGGATGFAPEQDTSLPADVALAYAKALRKPQPQNQMPQSFEQRWTAWGSAFGGTSFTDGNAAVGSNNVTASDYGFAAGMDYRASPDTTYGFGLTGGGTNWNLAQGLGSGRSDAFGAGAYAKTHFGAAYLSGALAFANHWFTTDRIALGDQLRASFTGQSYAARLEGGYRYAVPITGVIVGITPYAALQAQDFHTPSYSETDLTGGGLALSYNSMNATDTRSELGSRFDNLQVVDGMPLILRGRLAWAHDWYTNATALNAAFQTLPGTNFTVNGAAPPKNSALTTAAAELHINSNWTAIAKFDGDFGAGSQTYGGTGTLRYSW